MLNGGLDSSQVGEIKIQEFNAAGAVGVGGLELLDSGEGFGFGAAGEVERGVFGEEEAGKMDADAGVATCYDVDLHRVLVPMRWMRLDSITLPV